jgi:sulfite exporter TauE/SafE
MLSIDAVFYIFFSSGFAVGFGHCLSMCGPIVVSLSLNRKKKRIFALNLFYNLGRITTYTILGGLMGISGSFTAVTARMAGLQKGVMVFAGLLVILMGVMMSGWVPAAAIFKESTHFQGLISKGYQKLNTIESPAAYYLLGLLLGLLPCGPVYTALIAAARLGMEAGTARQGWLSGMGLMLAFGIGTVPALVLVGNLAGLGWLKSRGVIYKVGAIVMIVMGGYFVFRGITY